MTNTEVDHMVMVSELKKSGEEIYATITPLKLSIWHMATGICTEAGELLDAVKKHVIYDKPLDTDNVVEESGDLEFYMEGLRQDMQTLRDAILSHNTNKLRTRYGQKYSNEAAIARADKADDE
jgi:hypothetical protein